MWFRVAKVGTRTILNQLEANGVDIRESYDRRYSHGSYRDHLAFAVVRSPWDRRVSCWRDKVIQHNKYGFDPQTRRAMSSFGTFVEWVAEQDLDRCDVHLRRQVRLIDLNRLDMVGRHERFDDDVRRIFRELGLRFTSTHLNRSSAGEDFRSVYDDHTAEAVGHLYSLDCQLLGYSFDHVVDSPHGV